MKEKVEIKIEFIKLKSGQYVASLPKEIGVVDSMMGVFLVTKPVDKDLVGQEPLKD